MPGASVRENQAQNWLIEPEALLRRLVQIPSYGEVEQVQSIVASLMQQLGLEVQQFHSSSPVGTGLTNVVGRLVGSERQGAKSLILVAHVDTVPLGPMELWTRPPLDAQVEDGKMFGRGVYGVFLNKGIKSPIGILQEGN